MADDDGLVLHPREGERVAGSRGERAIVGIAAIALSGGFLILAANLISLLPADETAASPRPTAAAERTPRPSQTPAPPRTANVVLETPPAQPVELGVTSGSGYVEARSEVVIRRAPGDDALVLGVIAAGDGAYAESDANAPSQAREGWLHVYSEHGDGWVAADADLARYPDLWASWSEEIASVTGGPDGFVAQGWGPDPLLGGRWFDLFSADGVHWSRLEDSTSSMWDSRYAHGPAGWLRVGAGLRTGGATALWVSEMGPEGWQVIGPIEGIPPSSYVGSLAGSEVGYLFVAENGRGFSPGGDPDLWFSSDGLTWHETEPLDDLGLRSPVTVASTSGGFYAWSLDDSFGGPAGPAAFSADGRHWVGVEDAPDGTGLRIAAVGEGLVAIDHGPGSTQPRAWIAEVDAGGVTWRRTSDADAHFSGSAVSGLVSDGERATAFGMELPSERLLSWTFRDGAWSPPDRLPPEIGGVPRLAAAGGGGVVVLGQAPTLRARNPVFWAERDGTWVPEPRPVVVPVGDPSQAECDALPTNPIGLLFVERGLVVSCVGNTELTFRAWTEPCPGCYPTEPVDDPITWLVGSGPQLSLAINHSSAARFGITSPGVLDPALAYDPAWEGVWLEVTGHFDDPRAADCRVEQGVPEISWYEGRTAIITGCRHAFVITGVTILDDPAADPG